MHLDPIQLRVLGSLIEKEITTPENYPLSLNALVNACNQRSSRDPVLDLTEEQVRQALHSLEDLALVTPVSRRPRHPSTSTASAPSSTSAATRPPFSASSCSAAPKLPANSAAAPTASTPSTTSPPSSPRSTASPPAPHPDEDPTPPAPSPPFCPASPAPARPATPISSEIPCNPLCPPPQRTSLIIGSLDHDTVLAQLEAEVANLVQTVETLPGTCRPPRIEDRAGTRPTLNLCKMRSLSVQSLPCPTRSSTTCPHPPMSHGRAPHESDAEQNRLPTFLSQLPDAILLLDRNWVITYANAEALPYQPHSSRRHRPQNPLAALPGDHRHRGRALLSQRHGERRRPAHSSTSMRRSTSGSTSTFSPPTRASPSTTATSPTAKAPNRSATSLSVSYSRSSRPPPTP